MLLKRAAALCLILAVLSLAGCMRGGGEDENLVRWKDVSDIQKPALPERLKTDGEGVPALRVYDAASKKLETVDLETYVAGVVAGEMKNDWPEAALEAQAILARTFVLKFCRDKRSKHEGADISTDVAEAQAYAPEAVNARVRQAVAATRGRVLAHEGDYVNAWFHAHAGGATELPSVALDYREDDPAYLAVVQSEESDEAPEDVKSWRAAFTREEVAKACREAGLSVDAVETVALGEKGESGRSKTLLVNGKPVSAPTFRIRIGANRLKSTLIDRVRVQGGEVVFEGRGFGHGVGLSQWGAYAMAKDGEGAGEILRRYFRDVDVVKLW